MSLSIPETIRTTPSITNFHVGLDVAGLVGDLEAPGPFTVFSPTNAAFFDLPEETIHCLFDPEQNSLSLLVDVMLRQIVRGRHPDLRPGQGFSNLVGEDLTVHNRDGELKINGYATVLRPGALPDNQENFPYYEASNGVVYEISSFLFAPDSISYYEDSGQYLLDANSICPLF